MGGRVFERVEKQKGVREGRGERAGVGVGVGGGGYLGIEHMRHVVTVLIWPIKCILH